ncbi:hypothetical protein KPH14_013073, partial [Odynerus spinipes]
MSPFNGKGTEETNSADQYVVLDSTDLEALLEQFGNNDHSSIIIDLLKQFHEMLLARAAQNKSIFERDNLILESQTRLKETIDRLTELVIENIKRADEERKRADEERKRADEERKRREERYHDIMKSLDEIKSMLQQQKKSRREKCLAIINIEPGYKWYIVQRQRPDFDKAIASLLRKYAKRNPTVLKKWYGIPETVNVGESLKLRLDHGSGDDDGGNLRWLSRGNILSVVHRDEEAGPFYTNETILQETEAILRANERIEVSNEI